ncbi:hypothetical protein B0I72DRAFT_134835 [Yarrowia lipolytica]|jgi:hypothetical protein|uniref:YALI0D27236p n=2 Tax=Yarrowia lipolytica TaxID=4952 RepID=Q6C7K9_YARLI|nr:YALI0D27236p [Yarrowia lipolytica CLIB122]AOW04719.1 hypothetical protein YALI1_D35870g [Yarrowia lipolytica]KAB8283987.1 hypothetical protein BKA91DRAFT_136011 [Yarrowia lipolytica]KAE8172166.1 hypothetical protein BKA90DRAFT_137886 [Yarrowia lipolytica]KAJ8053859.1 hypothetical protein LXG23DRAFT_55431 [Yarrowia lipolytica]QNP98133.1 Hypothetical protein YALI2_D00574g [Yarrowia lipolytica]|eukprot:XP_503353.1 YALI0D27236p [Yarrowia lipolytica CLIB122]
MSADHVDNTIKKDASKAGDDFKKGSESLGDDVKKGWDELKEGASDAQKNLGKENEKIHDTFSGDFDKKAHQEGEKLKDANEKWTHGVHDKAEDFNKDVKNEFNKVEKNTEHENEKIRDTFDSKGQPHGTWDNFKEGASHAQSDLDSANKRFTSAVDESSEHFGKAVNSAWDSLKSGVNGLIGGEKK